ncbi:cyclic nucleotide-binding domain-containing protein [Alloalcanivorax gelatiniphagus]|uniref:Cyclic nucleotide-binding domain-containing protein n=1 Tax=Alloalcanivorax gelatiniphagus TaxID=1194167 RepID=A0ABY2XHV9_9GAMM|nr:cyclic nucleotide-binding domain-containing protein [Alloalcanivorax gelatiniphagus]TMW10582.1 cyclic nucleotide-binding domain-containing protein [Alloalcanivorax gelatiniphagus]|tara:strand:+ start:8137 stop:8598 length:462 start_codon:yes stop_codon:yes gene_type:complete
MSVAVAEVLARMRLFNGLDAEQLADAEKLVFVNRVAAGDTVCREGDRSDFVCFVVRGRLDILKAQGEDGGAAVIAHLTPGDSLGEMALVDHQPRSATVRAAEDTTLVVLTRKGFEQLRRRQPHAAALMMENIARLLCENLRQTSSRLARFMLP